MKESQIFLEHIRDSITIIKEYTANITRDEFLKNKMIQDAVIRNFEIIGEASKKVEESIKIKYSHIEWKKIAGMRDKLIHDYLGVDLWAVWNVIADIFPSFEANIEKIPREEYGME